MAFVGSRRRALAAAKLRGKIPGASATWQRPIWSASFSIGVHERLQSLVS